MTYLLLFFLEKTSFDRSTAKELGGTSLVITLPAPIFEFFFIIRGAIREELDPTKTLS